MISPRVLLVEDDLFIREVFAEAMSKAAFVVETAQNGEEAVTKIKQGGWDIVLMDNNLPHTKGSELVQQLKAEKDLVLPKHILFLTNTTGDSETSKINAISDGYLVKSDITPKDLIDKVKKLLGL